MLCTAPYRSSSALLRSRPSEGAGDPLAPVPPLAPLVAAPASIVEVWDSMGDCRAWCSGRLVPLGVMGTLLAATVLMAAACSRMARGSSGTCALSPMPVSSSTQ